MKTSVLTQLRSPIVLTPQEKAAFWSVGAAFVLGLATLQYRSSHAPAHREIANHRQIAKKTPAHFQRATPTPPAQEREEDDE